jgi:hypothetical protein
LRRKLGGVQLGFLEFGERRVVHGLFKHLEVEVVAQAGMERE